MVLRNWYNMMKAFRTKGTLTGAITKFDGYTCDAAYCSESYGSKLMHGLTLCPVDGLNLSTSISGGSYSYIVLGSGTTPATVDDYTLENMIRSGLTCTNSITVDDDNDAIYKLTLTNSSSEGITIGEIGIFASCPTMANNQNSTVCVLMERTVLNTPITIPAGGIGVIDYCIKIPIPTA